MTDERTYVRVHDGIEDHPKVAALSDKGFRLLITTWGWCSRHLTDGRVPDAVWRKRGTAKARDELMTAGLVHKHPGHVEMHDYLEHQRSAELIGEKKDARRRASLRANHQRHHVDKKVVGTDCEFCPTDAPTDPPSAPIRSPFGEQSESESEDVTDSQFGNESNLSNAKQSVVSMAKKKKVGREKSDTPPTDRASSSQNTRKTPSDSDSEPDSESDPDFSTETETETEKRSTYVGGASTDPAARRNAPRRGASGPTAVDAHRLVAHIIGPEFGSATRTALVIAAAELLREFDQATVAEALDDWRVRPGIGPGVLTYLVADIVKRRNGHGRPASTVASSPRLAKALGFLVPDDPLRAHLAGEPPELKIIEGGQTA